MRRVLRSTRALLCFGAVCAVLLMLPRPAQAQSTTYTACYVPDVGAVYMIGQQGLPSSCLESSHVEFTFGGGDSTGVTDHGNLSGLADDDHSRYLLKDGVRLTKGFAVSGAVGSGSIPTSGAGTRLMWYSGKSAFRVGTVDGTQWDDGNVGEHSVAFGSNAVASGQYATAFGRTSEATGRASTATGILTTASGDYATAMGNETTASGSAATAMGIGTTASGAYSTAMGHNALTGGQNGTFVYGDNSTDSELRATAPNQFLIRAAGGVGMGTNSPHTQLDVQRQVSGSAADTGNHVVNIENTATRGGDVLMLNSNMSQPGNVVNYLTFGSPEGNIGAIEGNGSGGVTLTSGSGDFAELLPRAREAESIEAGDVVGVFGGEITKRTSGAEQVMVVTDRAMILGNDPGAEGRGDYEKVAFMGQVPVRVRGPVEKGDLLIASGRDDGTARALAASEYSPVADGPIIGTAWEASSRGEQRVNTLVGTAGETSALRYVVQQQAQKIDRLERRDDRLERRVETLESTVQELLESVRTKSRN